MSQFFTLQNFIQIRFAHLLFLINNSFHYILQDQVFIFWTLGIKFAQKLFDVFSAASESCSLNFVCFVVVPITIALARHIFEYNVDHKFNDPHREQISQLLLNDPRVQLKLLSE